MLKTAIVTINVLALFALKFILGGDVTVSQNIPEQIAPGESFIIEVTVEKGDHEGFAKWQQKLPEGFIAIVKDAKGATFSFKKQEVKLIWMALPKRENITFSYEVKTDPTVKGVFTFDGKFSYLEENERKDIAVEAQTLKVGSTEDELVLTEDIETTSEQSDDDKTVQETKEDNPVTENSETNSSGENLTITGELVLDEDGIKVYRTIEHIKEANYLVSLKIEKGDMNSFGKIEEYIPEDFLVTSNESEQGIFSFNSNVMKILWMTIPQKSTIEISYNLESTSDLLDNPKIHGIFSYLNEDESMQKELSSSTFVNHFKSDEELLAEEQTQNDDKENSDLNNNMESEITDQTESNSDSKKLNETVTPQIESTIANDISEQSNKSGDDELIQSITDIPSPETNISYKVQIAAGKKEVKQAYFKTKHNISEMVSTEYHNNWYKYTLGKYDVYKAARDRRNKIWAQDNKINDAFVTAYNAGERITVQEALMISKQKWYK